MDASVLAGGRQIFARVTIRTWPQPENAHKKSLASRVKVCVYFLYSRLGMPLIITPFIEHELFYFGFHTGSATFSVVGWEHRRSKTLIDRQMLWEGSTTPQIASTLTNQDMRLHGNIQSYSSWEIRRLIPFCSCYGHTLRLSRLSVL